MQDGFIKNILTKNFVGAGKQFQTMISAKMINVVENDLMPEVSQRILVKESEEQIDELSKATLGSYVKKATKEVDDNSWKSGKARGMGLHAPAHSADDIKHRDKEISHGNKATKRRVGINKAVDKLTKEEVDGQE